MAVRKAEAHWEGTLKEGNGNLKLGSGSYEGPYSFTSRFEEGGGTNPEELLGAAHAGCFSMALSAGLERAGFPVNYVHTRAEVHILRGEAGMEIARIDLFTEGDVPGVDEAKFQEMAEDTKKSCIISRALASIPEVTVQATLKR